MPDQLPAVIVWGLVVFRLALLITIERGPYAAFEKLRRWVGAKASAHGDGVWLELAEAFHCPYCLGVWLSVPAGLLIEGFTLDAAVYWLAVSGVAAVATGIVKGLDL